MIQSRDRYLEWVEWAEIKLAELTHDRTIAEMLHTARYWEIRRLVPSDARPTPLIDAEPRVQRDNLHGMRENLEMHVNRCRAAPGHMTVVDSNSLLHYLLPDQIPWPEVVGHGKVRIVIPLRAIEDLDAMKYTDNGKRRERARALLPKLSEMISVMGSPTPLSFPNTTIKVPVEFIRGAARVKPPDADEEILFTCREMWQLSGQEGGVTLITADIAMRIRAEALGGIRPLQLPDKYQRDQE